jgi:hypothetical protein
MARAMKKGAVIAWLIVLALALSPFVLITWFRLIGWYACWLLPLSLACR